MLKRIFVPLAAAVFAVACLLLPAPDAGAHSLYIQSGRHQVAPGKRTPLFFCYGHHFPVDDAVRGAKLKSVRVLGPDGSVQQIAPRDETSLQSSLVSYDASGVYALTAETNPGYYTKWVDKKGRDRSSIKSMEALRGQASEILKSLYSKQYAKTYVLAGEAKGPFPAYVGLPLELVPAAGVFDLKQGDTLRLAVYRDGKPYAGDGEWDATYGGFSTESEDMYHVRRKASGGAFEVPLDRPGRWFVRYFIKTDAVGAEREKYFQRKETATLVLEIRNPRKRPRAGHH